MEFIAWVIVTLAVFILGLFAQTWWTSLNQKLLALDEHISDIKEARDAAVDYWRNDAADDGQPVRAARVRGLIFAALDYRERAENLLEGHAKNYRELMDRFYEAATGGDFESCNQKIDPRWISTIYETSAKIVLHLRHCRPGWIWYR